MSRRECIVNLSLQCYKVVFSGDLIDRGPDVPQALGRLEISVMPPPGTITLERARQYADLGVDRLIIWPPDGIGAGDLRTFVSHLGDTVIGRV